MAGSSAFKSYLMLIPRMDSSAAKKISSELSSGVNASGAGRKVGDDFADGVEDGIKNSAVKEAIRNAVDGSSVGAVHGANTGHHFSEGFKTKLSAAKVAIGNILASLASSAANVIKEHLGNAISRVDTLNAFPKIMANMGISAEAADAALRKLDEGISGLPTTMNTAVLGVERFVAKNGDVEKSAQYFLALNDAIIAGAAPAATQEAAVEQLMQAYARGKFEMEEWKSALVAMPAQMNQIAQSFGKTTDELYEGLKDGSISMDEFMDHIVKLDVEGGEGFASFKQQAQDASGGIETSLGNVGTALDRNLANIIKEIDGDDHSISSVSKVATAALNGLGGAIVGAISGGKEKYSELIGSIEGVAESNDDATQAAAGLLATVSAFDPKVDAIFGIGNAIAGFFSWLGETVPGFFSGIVEGVSNFVGGIGETISGFFGGIGEFFVNLWNGIIEGVSNFVASVVGFFQGLWDGIVSIVTGIVDNVTGFFQGLWDGIVSIVTGIVDNVGGFFQGLWDNLVRIATGIVDNVRGFFQGLWDGLVGIVSGLVSNVTGFFRDLGTNLGDAARGIWDTVAGAFRGMWEAVTGTVQNLWNDVTGFFGGLWDAISGAVWNVWNNVSNAFSQGVDNTISFVSGLPQRIVDFFSNAGDWLFNAGQNMINGFIDGIWDMFNNAANAVGDFVQGIVDFFPHSPAKRGPLSGKGWTLYSGRALVEAFGEGMLDASGELERTAERALSAVDTDMTADIDVRSRYGAEKRPSVAASVADAVKDAFASIDMGVYVDGRRLAGATAGHMDIELGLLSTKRRRS